MPSPSSSSTWLSPNAHTNQHHASSSSTSSSSSSSSSQPKSPPQVLTYSLDDKMVYVTPAEDYEQALDFAYSVYPEELKGVPRDRISFSINICIHGKPRTSRIGPMAWKVVVSTLKQYELVLVSVHSEEAPPTYSPSSSRVGFDAKDDKSDSQLRPPSDLRRTPSPSPSKKGGARGWIEKLL